MKTIPEAVYDAFMFNAPDYREMDLDTIAYFIVERDNDYTKENIEEIRKKVSSYLSNATTRTVKGKRVENKESLYQRVPNGKGGYKKGVYKLRKPKKKVEKPLLPPIPKETISTTDSNFIGKAGEMAVCSELMFREYYAATMPLDDGIDIVAMKDGKTFYVQVKTTQITKEGNFSIKIPTASYERYNRNDCFYVFVIRGEKNTFIVTTAHDIWRWIKLGSSKNDRNITITFTQLAGQIQVNGEDISQLINAFDILK